MRAADDFASIRARMKELQPDRGKAQPRSTVRDWKDDPLGPTDTQLVEEVKKIIVRARFI